jgi:hypothetical protein
MHWNLCSGELGQTKTVVVCGQFLPIFYVIVGHLGQANMKGVSVAIRYIANKSGGGAKSCSN